MKWWFLLALAFVVAIFLLRPAAAQMRVDTAIVLLSDVSASMNPDERAVAIEAHVLAIRSAEFLNAIQRGYNGRIALAYVEYSDSVQIVVPWTLIDGPQAAAVFTQAVRHNERDRMGPGTGIGRALHAALVLLESLPWQAENLVVDVLGDGQNNSDPPIAPPRQALLDIGVRINTLALMRDPDAGVERQFSEMLAGGPGHFAMSIRSADQMPMAMRRKLILELF